MKDEEILKMDFDNLNQGLKEGKFSEEETKKIVDKIEDYSKENGGINTNNILYKSVAENQNTGAETLDKIAELSNSVAVKEAIVENSNTSAETLNKIVDKTDDVNVLIAVAENKNTDADTLDKLSKVKNDYEHDDFALKLAVVKNDNVSESTLDRMENSKRYGDKEAVAEGTKSEDRIEKLLNEDRMKSYVAKNENIGEDLQKELLKLNSGNVDRGLAENKNASPEVLDKIAEKQLEMLSKSSESTSTTNLDRVIQNDNVSDKTLQKISDFANENGKEKLAESADNKLAENIKNFNEIWENVADGTSKEDLLKAGADEKQVDVAINLETLSRDGEINLSTSEIDNMSFDKAKDLIDLNTAETSSDSNILNKLAETSTNEEVLKAIVENTDTSIETLETIANKTDSSEVKELLNEKFEEAVKDGIKDYIEDDGMRFDSKFNDFVDEKMDLNSVDLVEGVKDVGLEKFVEGQIETFKDHSDVQNSEIAYDLASFSQNEKLLETLSKSDNEDVLRAVAENYNTNENTLDKIANKSDNEEVLTAVVNNENVSNETLATLAENKNDEVADKAVDKLSERLEEAKELAQDRGLLSEDKAEAKSENKQEDKNEVKNENKVEQGQSM